MGSVDKSYLNEEGLQYYSEKINEAQLGYGHMDLYGRDEYSYYYNGETDLPYIDFYGDIYYQISDSNFTKESLVEASCYEYTGGFKEIKLNDIVRETDNIYSVCTEDSNIFLVTGNNEYSFPNGLYFQEPVNENYIQELVLQVNRTVEKFNQELIFPDAENDGSAFINIDGSWKVSEGYGYIDPYDFDKITWDGPKSGEAIIPFSYYEDGELYDFFVKVKDKPLIKKQLDRASCINTYYTGIEFASVTEIINETELSIIENTEDLITVFGYDYTYIVSILNPGTYTIRSHDIEANITFDEIGTYFLCTYNDTYKDFISSLERKLSKTIDLKLLPQGYGGYINKVLSWNGNTEGLVHVYAWDTDFYLISEEIFSPEDFLGAIFEDSTGLRTIVTWDQIYYSDWYITIESDNIAFKIITELNPEFDFSTTGVYFPIFEDNYPTRIELINKQEIKKFDQELIPEDNQKIQGAGTGFGANDTVNIVAGSNVTVTPDTTNKKITIAATDTKYTAATASPPAVAATGAQGSSANYARQDHTHQGITGITMNGASKGTSGIVNLGTVVTDVSGKENTSNKVTSISAASTDIQYPSAKAVKDYVEANGGKIDTIYLNGEEQQIVNKEVDLETVEVFTQSTAPSSPKEGDFWIDTSTNPTDFIPDGAVSIEKVFGLEEALNSKIDKTIQSSKTDTMIEEVGIDENGKLWSAAKWDNIYPQIESKWDEFDTSVAMWDSSQVLHKEETLKEKLNSLSVCDGIIYKQQTGETVKEALDDRVIKEDVLKEMMSHTTLSDVEINFLVYSDSVVPTSSISNGRRGQVVFNSNYLYICVATNTWRRFLLSEF